jgi:DNA repair protein RadC
MVARKVSKIINKLQSVVGTAARSKSRASGLGSPSNAQETDIAKHQRRTKEAAQSEKDKFQEPQSVARDVWQKELRERASKQADRQMCR